MLDLRIPHVNQICCLDLRHQSTLGEPPSTSCNGIFLFVTVSSSGEPFRRVRSDPRSFQCSASPSALCCPYSRKEHSRPSVRASRSVPSYRNPLAASPARMPHRALEPRTSRPQAESATHSFEPRPGQLRLPASQPYARARLCERRLRQRHLWRVGPEHALVPGSEPAVALCAAVVLRGRSTLPLLVAAL